MKKQNMMRNRGKCLCSLLLGLLLAFCLPCSSFASSVTTNGSISLTLYESGIEKKPISGGVFMLYKVANAVSQGTALSFAMAADFVESDIPVSSLNSEGIAEYLTVYATEKNLPYAELNAGTNNTVVFRDLEQGVYLIAQKGTVSGFYPSSPFLITLPTKSANGTLMYDIDASPKAEALPIGSDTLFTRLKVIKVWNNGSSTQPEKIEIKLLRNYTMYQTLELSAENDWTYTWDKLPSNYVWTAVEASVPDGYSVSYSTAGNTITILNQSVTYVEPTTPEEPTSGTDEPSSGTDEPTSGSDEPTSGPSEDSSDSSEPTSDSERPTTSPAASNTTTNPSDNDTPSLIHTGQLTWPIPVLAIAGILLFAFGWILTSRKGKERRG